MASGRGAQRLMRRCRFLALALALAGCAQPAPVTDIAQPAGAPPLKPIAVDQLPGWQTDDTQAALAAFVRGCQALLLMPIDQNLGGNGYAQQAGGEAGMWQNTCLIARAVTPGDEDAARAFFTTNFAAYQVDESAQITGYFEPEFLGSKNAAPGYPVPIYARPADPHLASLPRQRIDDGALTRKAPVTAYLTNPVDAYMLQIQGSGRILLPDGRVLRVGFDGQNGQPYTPIGRLLVAQGDLAQNNVSFQSISDWLTANPAAAKNLMEQNQRYVFLRPLGDLPDDLGAPGTLGVPLTAGRSLAVDDTQIPLGSPVFVATTDPVTGQPLDRLAVAQDTGGGIRGAAAADLFFGAGPDAEATAGRMMQPGQLFLLLPKSIPAS